MNRLIPRIIQQMAAKASAEFVEKWTGRIIPVASSLIGAVLNYYFVRGWGEGLAGYRGRVNYAPEFTGKGL